MSSSSADAQKRTKTKWADENLKNRRRRNRKISQKQKILADHSSLRGREIFENELVLGIIFKAPSLSVRDLKSFRSVNSLWLQEATNVLIRNHTTQKIILSGYSNSEDNLVFLDKSRYDPLEHIEVFLSLLEASASFPCNNFSLSGTNLASEYVQRLLWAHGKNFKNLEITKIHGNLRYQVADIKWLDILLTQQAPNLQSLKFIGIPHQWKTSAKTSFLETASLKSLKNISARYFDFESGPFLQKLLLAAPNLKSAKSLDVFRSNTMFANAVSSCGRACLLKDLNFNLSFNSLSMEEEQTQIRIYEDIVKSEPKLKSICCRLAIEELRDGQDVVEVRVNIVGRLHQYANVLNNCLKVSGPSLEHIENFVCLLNLPGLQLPPLPRINLLSLYNSDLDHPRDYVDFFEGFGDEGNSVFCPGCHFSDVFPNLESIFVIRQFNNYDTENWNHNALNLQGRNVEDVFPHEGVKELVFWTPINPMLPGHVEYFSHKFPHLKSVTFPKLIQFLEASQFIWTRLTNLEELRLTIEIDTNGYSGEIENTWSSPFPSLEQAFTGFSRETCLRLLEINELNDIYFDTISPSSELEGLRTNPSVLSLTRLKNLVISLDCWGNWDKYGPPIFTQVTGIFGFSLCPGLLVTLNVLRLNDGSDFRPEEWIPLRGIVPYVHEIRGVGRFR